MSYPSGLFSLFPTTDIKALLKEKQGFFKSGNKQDFEECADGAKEKNQKGKTSYRKKMENPTFPSVSLISHLPQHLSSPPCCYHHHLQPLWTAPAPLQDRTLIRTWLSAKLGLCREQSWLPSSSSSILQPSCRSQLNATCKISKTT